MGSFRDFAVDIVDAINSVAGLVVAFIFVALIFIGFWYFIYKGSDAKARETGRALLIWGIIGAVVVTSLWGIVRLVKDTLGL